MPSCSHIIHYLMVHRRIAGDVPIYLKLAFKVTHPFRKRRFQQIHLIVPQTWDLAKKTSIITNRKSTMRFPSNHRWTVCVNPKSPKGWFKTRIFYILCILWVDGAGASWLLLFLTESTDSSTPLHASQVSLVVWLGSGHLHRPVYPTTQWRFESPGSAMYMVSPGPRYTLNNSVSNVIFQRSVYRV